jgi:hypothetical protein
MKYILSKNQYNLLSEALGVPNSILEAAEEIYDLFSIHIKSIKTKKNTYNFNGNVNIELGDKNKILIDKYVLEVFIKEIDDFDQPPTIASMGMSQTFMFDKDIMMKRTMPSTEAKFQITYVVGNTWKPKELYQEFINEKEEYISSLSHELKHKYDKQSKKIDLIGKEAEYHGSKDTPRTNISVIDSEFLFYLYYIDISEVLVRSTEVASHIRSNKISKENFKEFLMNNKTFKILAKIREFSYERLVEGIKQEMDKVDNILRRLNERPELMTEDEKVNRILELVYINLVNTKFNIFDDLVSSSLDNLGSFFGILGLVNDPSRIKIDKLREKFYNYLTKFRNDPTLYFKHEIKRFNQIGDQVIRKISKLYDMAYVNENKSIIRWDLHNKLKENLKLEKQYIYFKKKN